MQKHELIAHLQAQLEALTAEGPYPIQELKVWVLSADTVSALGAALVRSKRKAWSWGRCNSETCAHNSHDPYQTGDVVFFRAKPIGKSEDGDDLYLLPDGTILEYLDGQRNGFHFAPMALLQEHRT